MIETARKDTGRSLRPVATFEDVARAVEQLDDTISQILVVLYHVVQAQQDTLQELKREEKVRLHHNLVGIETGRKRRQRPTR